VIITALVSVVLGASPAVDVGGVVREAQRHFLDDGADAVSMLEGRRVVSQPDGAMVLEGPTRWTARVVSVQRSGPACEIAAPPSHG